MWYITAERRIVRPPRVVWERLLDVDAALQWLEGAAQVHAPAALVKGATVSITWQPSAGHSLLTTSVITSVREGELLTVETRGGGRLSFDRVRLTPCAEGTTIELVSEVMNRPGLAGLLMSPHHLFGLDRHPTPLELAYERCLDAFACHVEASSLVPYR